MNLSLICVALYVSGHATLSPLQDQKPISISHGVASVRQVIDAIAQQTGSKLSTAPVMNNEIVVLSVKEAPLKDVLQQISDITAGEWVQAGELTTLTRSQSKLRVDQEAELKQRMAGLQKSLDQLRKAAGDPVTEKDVMEAMRLQEQLNKDQKNDDWDRGRYEKLRAINARRPIRRGLTQLLQSIDLKTLASLRSGDRVVFSSAPTPMQKPLPSSASSILRTMVAESKMWAKFAPKPVDNEATVYSDGDEVVEQVAMPYYGGGDTLTEMPAKMLIAAEVSEMMGNFGGVQCTLMAFDQKGKQMASQSHQLSFFDEREAEKAFGGLAPKDSDKEIVLSPESKEIMTKIGSLYGGMGSERSVQTQLSEKAQAMLMNPEKHDPLTFVCSDSFLAFAAAKNTNFIASVPDIAFIFAFFARTGKITVEMFETMLNQPFLMQHQEANGWLTYRSTNAYGDRLDRTDRAATGQFVRTVVAEGRASLDVRAAYALKSPSSMGFMDMAMFCVSLLTNDMNNMGDWGMSGREYLKLYGTLTAAQRTHLVKGGKIQAGSMSPLQLQIIRRIVYGSRQFGGPGLQYTPPTVEPKEGSLPDPEFYDEMEQSLMSEPTEALPNGIPNYSEFTMSSRGYDVLFLSSTKGKRPMMGGPSEIDQVAWSLTAQERPDLFPYMQDEDRHIDRFSPASAVEYTLTLQFRPDLSANSTLSDYQKPGAAVPLEQLPADILKRLKDAMAKQKEMYKDMKPEDMGEGQGRGGYRPPPAR